jgi:predicted GNAT family acetyltransferase
MSIKELDNPIWHSLNNAHKDFAIGGDLAKRYLTDVVGASGLKENTEAAFTELATICPEGATAVVYSPELEQSQWEIVFQVTIFQMVCGKDVPAPDYKMEIQALGLDDVPEMLALIELTQPGPFLERTVELGAYYGIRQEGQLVAMAGSRMFTPHYREISAVCTHPDYRGKGYAGLLSQHLAQQFQQDGIIPFLHVAMDNHNAQSVYKKLGFEVHQEITLAVIRQKES